MIIGKQKDSLIEIHDPYWILLETFIRHDIE